MSYDVSLYKVPLKLKKQHFIDDELFEIAYGNDNEKYLLEYTNFSMGNPNAVVFAKVFDIVLTNNDYFKIYKISHYHEALNRVESMSLDNELEERIKSFLNVIVHELNNGEILFFCCG